RQADRVRDLRRDELSSLASFWMLLVFSGGRAGRAAVTSAVRIVRGPMAAFDCRYELRRGEEVVATGHLSHDRPFEVGERVEIAGSAGTVRAVEPLLGEHE